MHIVSILYDNGIKFIQLNISAHIYIYITMHMMNYIYIYIIFSYLILKSNWWMIFGGFPNPNPSYWDFRWVNTLRCSVAICHIDLRLPKTQAHTQPDMVSSWGQPVIVRTNSTSCKIKLQNSYPPSLTARPWKMVVGRQAFPFGFRPIFRGELLKIGRVIKCISSNHDNQYIYPEHTPGNPPFANYERNPGL